MIAGLVALLDAHAAVPRFTRAFEEPNQPVVATCGAAVSEVAPETLWSTASQPLLSWGQVDTVLIDEGGWMNPSAAGGRYALGMWAGAGGVLATFDAHSDPQLTFGYRSASIRVADCAARPSAPMYKVRLAVYDSPFGAYLPNDPLLHESVMTLGPWLSSQTLTWFWVGGSFDISAATTGVVTVALSVQGHGYVVLDDVSLVTGLGGPDDASETDADAVLDDVDNCVGTYNPDQSDADLDGVGDACEPVLAITGTCPGRVTFEGRVRSFGGGQLLSAATEGQRLVPSGHCRGTETMLGDDARAHMRFSALAGRSFQLDADLPAAACGRLYQVMSDGCQMSNEVWVP